MIGASDTFFRGSEAASQEQEPYLVHLSRKAMAGEFEICLPVAIAGEATATALVVLDLVQLLETQLSFFQPDSEISLINRQASDTAVEVEPRLFALLQWAMQLWQESGVRDDLTARPSGKLGALLAARCDPFGPRTGRGQSPRRRRMGGTRCCAMDDLLSPTGGAAELGQHRQGLCGRSRGGASLASGR